MATVPLILRGAVTIDGDDFSDAITKVIISGAADEIEIPATLATPKTKRKGGVLYSIQLDYLSNDLADELFTKLWTALTTGDGELAFTAKMRDGATAVDNPEWSGTLVVTAAALGGDAEGLSADSVTFPLTAAPTPATS